MPQLFISYARENRPDVEALVRDLHALGHQTWLDTSLRGGQSWWHEILQRIADSDVFMAIVSGHTLSSVACKRELEWALALNKPVLPLAVERLPDALPRNLSMRQIVDYSTPSREAAFALAGALGTLPAAPPPPDHLPEPPAAPLSYLSELVEQVAQSEPLTQQQQRQILIQLEPALRSADAEERRGGRYVLKVFSKRGDLYADVDRSLSQMDLSDNDTEPRSAEWVPARLDQGLSATAPVAPAGGTGNLLGDPGWADALNAYFAQRWGEAVERFEMLQVAYPGEARVETRLKEARQRRDTDVWSSKAEASAAECDWDAAVIALENLTVLDPDHPGVDALLEQARLAQRRKALVDEATALHQAGRWTAVVAAGLELARIDPDNSDPGGIVADARSKVGEAELADRYGRAINHLDQEQWQQAADLFAAIEKVQPGYRDAASLLKTAHQKMDDAPPMSRPTAPARTRTDTPPVSQPDRGRRRPGKWIAAAAVGVALAGILILAVVQRSTSSDGPTSAPSSTTTTSAPRTSAQAPGPDDTLTDYLTKNNIQGTWITPDTPGAPKIDFPDPKGWTRLPEGTEGQYFGIGFDTPSNPTDPPTITATVQKLSDNVDVDAADLLAVAPRQVKHLPGLADAQCAESTLGGFPACQLGGLYDKDGVQRAVAQKTVIIQQPDGTYILVINAGGLAADIDAMNAAATEIDDKTTITP